MNVHTRQAPIVLAAGGTGGHVFPAQAVAEELQARGRRLVLVTDRRGASYGGALAQLESHHISAGTPLARRPIARGLGIIKLLLGMLEATQLLRRLKPAAVIGFGGYPSVPTMIAASRARLATAIHEQNAILGRANRLLAPRVLHIATSFERTDSICASDRKKIAITGNPVRPAIAALASSAYPTPSHNGPLNLLIIGGSQGAQLFADVVPAAIALLPPQICDRLDIAQHCRPEDLDRVRESYAAGGIHASCSTFFEDIAARLKKAHLVICRAGASTVSELAASGRPAILVPLAHATDDHQTANAASLQAAGGAIILGESEAKPARLAECLNGFLASPKVLARAALAAHGVGRPDAGRALADLIEALAPVNGDPPNMMRRQAA